MSKSNEFANFDNGDEFEGFTSDMVGGFPLPEKQITAFKQKGELSIHGFQLTRRGLIPPADATREQWLDIGEFLFQVEDGIQLLIGDYLLGIEHEYGVTYAQLAKAMGKSEKTLRNYKAVAGSINMSLRRDNLTYTHYSLVQGMKPKEQKYWIDLASAGDLDKDTGESKVWSVSKLTTEIRKKSQIELPTKTQVDLFERRAKPVSVNRLETLWTRARSGDEESLKKLDAEVGRWRRWLDRLTNSVTE